ncbi:MAG: hypothetical protein RMN25_12940, partial [Anaerolineae bacterium]|nr:hypothetical protein [Thermoflexales bacterium]MDW8408678.1 hypothetical protein [Anaerolineae bacterium]
EWMSEPGLGAGPFYKPSDEARVITWLRHHLVTEEPPDSLCADVSRWTLWLAKGAPRAWHAAGESFGVSDMPTFFGQVSYRVDSFLVTEGELRARVRLNLRRLPREIRLRLRHPTHQPMHHATINGRPAQFDPEGEYVVLPADVQADYHVIVGYR